MSTIVVCRNENEVVIGADTLTSFGYTRIKSKYIKNKSKITKVGDSYIASSGNAVFPIILEDYFKKKDNCPKLNNVNNIFNTFVQLHKSLKDHYYVNPQESEDDSFESSQLICLIANPYGIFGIDQYRYVEEYASFSAYGSGKEYAMGAMKVAFELGIDIEEVVRKGLDAASEFDDATDGPFEIYRIPLKKKD